MIDPVSETSRYSEYLQAAKTHGLTWGGDWADFTDSAHVQLLPNSKLAKVKGGWLPPEE